MINFMNSGSKTAGHVNTGWVPYREKQRSDGTWISWWVSDVTHIFISELIHPLIIDLTFNFRMNVIWKPKLQSKSCFPL